MKMKIKRIRKKTAGWIQRIRKYLASVDQRQGNVLLYIILVMVIFGMLGATMVSLFTTATVSTATLNEDRRARYLYESAGRYAMSVLRNSNFDSAEIDALNTTTYTVDPPGTFEFDIYGLWFRSNETKNIPATLPTISARMEEGVLPSGLSFPGGNVFAVNIESTYVDPASGNIQIPNPAAANDSGVISVTSISGTGPDYTLNVISGEYFSVSEDERICLAVRPTSNQNPGIGGSLNVHENARFIFPRYNGAVFIKTDVVYYEEAVHYNGSRVELRNLSAAVTVSSGDYVILWPTNHTVIPTANTANMSYGGSAEYALNVVDTGDLTLGKYGSPDPDISMPDLAGNFEQKETETSFVTPVATAGQERIEIGGGSADRFGGGWYNEGKSVGGVTNFCTDGECRFGVGFRAFFTFTKTGGGRGFIFALLNGEENLKSSIGGDIAASELLGYAGDSRTDALNPSLPADFLDGLGEGLDAPKIGLEFDTVIDFDAAFEANQIFCAGSSLVTDTRNDPLTGSRDAVQYVFWGRDFVDLTACRNTPGRDTYDDNRHDALGFASGNWAVDLFDDIDASPVVGPDGTIYTGSDIGRVFAVNPDGTLKWQEDTFPNTDVNTPALSPDGSNLYVRDVFNGYIFDTSTGARQLFGNFGAAPGSGPAVDSSGFVYISAGTEILKIDPASPSTPVASFSAAPPAAVRSAPVLNTDGSRIYVIIDDPLGSDRLYALNATDLTEIWNRTVGTTAGEPAVHPTTGDIYVSRGGGMVRLASNGSFYGGAFGIAASVTTGPVLSKDGNFVYIGYDNGLLLARTATLNSEWSFSTSSVSGLSLPIRGTPSTDGSGHIYFGADDGNVYALYGDGRLKWNFTTGGEVRTQPAIGNGGIVYAGSYDNNLWAIEEFSEPRNYRQNIPNAPDPELEQNLVAYNAADATDPYPAGFIPTNSDDWIRSGPWAVRMEVTRDTISGDRGDYQLRTWMYQCGNGDCSDILGTFYENTRIEFNPGNLPPLLVQSFSLPDNGSGPIAGTPDNRDFERFLFGFTSASETGDSQIITIRNFQLSFIRPGDPVTTEDFLP